MSCYVNIKERKDRLLEYISRVDDETVISEFEKVAEKSNEILLPPTRRPFSVDEYISDTKKSIQDAQNGKVKDIDKVFGKYLTI